ncbi:MAG: hypothetical protein Q7R80_00125 [bacterium]|nr:hypothetical protein [bacterium]MDP3770848.1 hypothetical protein [bacterium]
MDGWLDVLVLAGIISIALVLVAALSSRRRRRRGGSSDDDDSFDPDDLDSISDAFDDD